MSSQGTFRRNAVVYTQEAPKPLPVFSQAIVANNMVFVSGNVGMNPKTGKLQQGVSAQTVGTPYTNQEFSPRAWSALLGLAETDQLIPFVIDANLEEPGSYS